MLIASKEGETVKSFKRKMVGQIDLFRIVTLTELAMKAEKTYCNFVFQQGVKQKTRINPNGVKSVNQRTNGPVNVHLISGSIRSINHTKPD